MVRAGRHFGVAFILSAALGPALPAAAAPTHFAAVQRPPVTAPARLGRMPLRTTFPPFRFAVRSGVRSNDVPPVRALPLKPAPTPVLGLPAFLPRVAFGTLLPALAAAGGDDCAAHSPTVQLSVLPSSPFVPARCTRRSLRDAADSLPSLAPGRNKNALYGPGISANEITDPQ